MSKNYLPRSVTEILFKKRTDVKMAMALSRGVASEQASQILAKVQENGSPACCPSVPVCESELSRDDQWRLWKLMAAGEIELDVLFAGLQSILADSSFEAQLAAAEVLRNSQKPSVHRLLKALAPGLMLVGHEEHSEPDENALKRSRNLRESLKYVLTLKQDNKSPLSNALFDYFRECSLEAFIQHLDSLTEESLKCLAEIVALVEVEWAEKIKVRFDSDAPQTRRLAVIAASYLGTPPTLKTHLHRLTLDKFDMIREEAEYALSLYPNMPAAKTAFVHSLQLTS
jgi:hypothetical protein